MIPFGHNFSGDVTVMADLLCINDRKIDKTVDGAAAVLRENKASRKINWHWLLKNSSMFWWPVDYSSPTLWQIQFVSTDLTPSYRSESFSSCESKSNSSFLSESIFSDEAGKQVKLNGSWSSPSPLSCYCFCGHCPLVWPCVCVRVCLLDHSVYIYCTNTYTHSHDPPSKVASPSLWVCVLSFCVGETVGGCEGM